MLNHMKAIFLAIFISSLAYEVNSPSGTFNLLTSLFNLSRAVSAANLL